MKKEVFKEELESLYEHGIDLANLFYYTYIEKNPSNVEKKDYEELSGKYHSFEFEYQNWYIRASNIINLIIPDTIRDFKDYFEPKRNNINEENYSITDFINQVCIRTPDKYKLPINYTVFSNQVYSKIIQQTSILNAAMNILDSRLFNIESEMKYNLLEDELENAIKLLKNGFIRASGVLAGVSLETHLFDVCNNHGLKIKKKNPSIADYNEILKNNNILDVPVWRKIQQLSDVRNYCSHKKEREPKRDEVEELISGVKKIIVDLM